MNLHWMQILFYCFSLAGFIQILYYLFFFLRLAFHKPLPASTVTHPVSIIICARDEAANLIRNIPFILAQQYSTRHEVIVVNDNSFDESKYILEEYKREFDQMQLIEIKQEAMHIPGKKYPLTIGIKTAKYDTVLMTDADCKPAGNMWAEKMQQGYKENVEIVLGYGAYHKSKGFLNKLIRWETFHTALQYFSYAKAGIAYMGVGRNLSYKKSVFFKHKGFSSHNNIVSGDDDLFINKAATKKNTAIVIDPDSFTLSEPAKTLKQWVKQKTRHYSTGKYYKPIHKFLLGLYALTHFLIYPLFISALFFNWKISLIIFWLRLLFLAFILFRTMKKLNEEDLFPWFLVLDIWMFFYYIIFSFSIFKKPLQRWK